MTVTRRLLVACCGCLAIGVATASASLMTVGSARLASGDAPVAGCDADGVAVSYANAFDTAVADYRTTAVTVSGIAAPCAGRTLSVTVRAANGTVLWQGSAAVSGSSVALSTSPFRSSSVAGAAVALTG